MGYLSYLLHHLICLSDSLNNIILRFTEEPLLSLVGKADFPPANPAVTSKIDICPCIFDSYKVCSPTTWYLGEIIEVSVLILRVYNIPSEALNFLADF